MPPLSNAQQEPGIRLLVAAIAINLLLGVLYGWSLFIAPLEETLEVTRATLSLVPGLGLLCFTAGVLVHDALIRRLRLSLLASGVVATAGFGHLLFWLFPSYLGLLFGYGVVFGSAAGIGYGLALALARGSLTPTRGWAVGLTVAALAASGMVVSTLGTVFGTPDHVPNLFGIIGVVYCCSALAFGLVLRGSRLSFIAGRRPGGSDLAVLAGPFLRLAIGFFALCYLGLMFVGHGAAILRELDVSVAVASLTPFVLNSGYIVGALAGGVVAARVEGRVTLLTFLLASTLSALVMTLLASPAAWITAIFVIGMGFGSTVSVFIMLLTACYGAERAGFLFGRLNISYGLAGFLAPAITGWLYELNGDYAISLWFGGLLGILGLFAIAGRTARRAETSR